jgi:hypothetical protein
MDDRRRDNLLRLQAQAGKGESRMNEDDVGWIDYDEQMPPQGKWVEVRGQFGLKKTNWWQGEARWEPIEQSGGFKMWSLKSGDEIKEAGSWYFFVDFWRFLAERAA